MQPIQYEYVSPPEEKKCQYIGQKITILVMFIITVIINALTGAGIIGKSQKELSDKYMTLITPPGYTFSIWGVIYFFWGLFVVLQFVPNKYLSHPRLFYSNTIRGMCFPFFANFRGLDLGLLGAAF